MTHHIVRRKGLTVKLARRMKLTYPRAIMLVQRGMIHLDSLITHHMPLEAGDRAFWVVEAYDEGIVKAVVTP